MNICFIRIDVKETIKNIQINMGVVVFMLLVKKDIMMNI